MRRATAPLGDLPAPLARAPRAAVVARAAAGSKRKNLELYAHEEAAAAAVAAALGADGDPRAPAPASPPALPLPAAGKLTRRPEVLAPAGGWPQLRAAVENGADAVYFGVGAGGDGGGLLALNARARADNFDAAELPEVMAYLHARGVKGYACLNVLVFDGELEGVEALVRRMAAARVDAVIIQDVGAAALAAAAAPGLPLHGSTQMSITSGDGAEFAAARGVRRVVVGRELSVAEVGAVAAGTSAEVEAFVHGALCVSYSGQCFSSEAWGGRSANRGACAQACRLPYGLVVDGRLEDLGPHVGYPLSPQDLAGLEHVPALVAAGVACLKIEGRLKGPEYVAATTRAYRAAVDAAWAALSSAAGGAGGGAGAGARGAPAAAAAADPAAWRDLRQVFARGQDAAHTGLTPGFLEGPRHQRLVRGRAPRHRGVFVGEVESAGAAGVVVRRLAAPLRRGDGVVVDAGDAAAREQGGALFGLEELPPRGGAAGRPVDEAAEGARARLVFGRGALEPAAVRPGDLVWRTRDPRLEARLRATYEGLPAGARRRAAVAVRVAARLGEPLEVEVEDGAGRVGRGRSAAPAAPAAAAPLDAAALQKAVGVHLGGDSDGDGLVAAVASWDFSGVDEGLFVPAGQVKAARRAAVAELAAAQRAAAAAAAAAGVAAAPALPRLLREVDARGAAEAGAAGAPPLLRVLCRTRAQVEAAVALPWLEEVVVDFLEAHGLREAVAAVRAAGKRVVVAAPRVLKPGEARLAAFYLKLGADALLVRSAGLLHALAALGGPGAALPGTHAGAAVVVPRLEGDFSLNAANVLAADALLAAGLSRLALTFDADAEQAAALAARLGRGRARRLEVIAHAHVPIFHTEHCVFARFLSDGNSFADCGRPCEASRLHLRGPDGGDHLVLADMGCRNTVFNARAQSAAPWLGRLAAAGVGCLRVEMVDEPPQVVAPLLEAYRAALAEAVAAGAGGGGSGGGGPAAAKLWAWMAAELRDANGRAHGVELGSLAPRRERAPAEMKPTAASRRR